MVPNDSPILKREPSNPTPEPSLQPLLRQTSGPSTQEQMPRGAQTPPSESSQHTEVQNQHTHVKSQRTTVPNSHAGIQSQHTQPDEEIKILDELNHEDEVTVFFPPKFRHPPGEKLQNLLAACLSGDKNRLQRVLKYTDINKKNYNDETVGLALARSSQVSYPTLLSLVTNHDLDIIEAIKGAAEGARKDVLNLLMKVANARKIPIDNSEMAAHAARNDENLMREWLEKVPSSEKGSTLVLCAMYALDWKKKKRMWKLLEEAGPAIKADPIFKNLPRRAVTAGVKEVADILLAKNSGLNINKDMFVVYAAEGGQEVLMWELLKQEKNEERLRFLYNASAKAASFAGHIKIVSDLMDKMLELSITPQFAAFIQAARKYGHHALAEKIKEPACRFYTKHCENFASQGDERVFEGIRYMQAIEVRPRLYTYCSAAQGGGHWEVAERLLQMSYEMTQTIPKAGVMSSGSTSSSTTLHHSNTSRGTAPISTSVSAPPPSSALAAASASSMSSHPSVGSSTSASLSVASSSSMPTSTEARVAALEKNAMRQGSYITSLTEFIHDSILSNNNDVYNAICNTHRELTSRNSLVPLPDLGNSLMAPLSTIPGVSQVVAPPQRNLAEIINQLVLFSSSSLQTPPPAFQNFLGRTQGSAPLTATPVPFHPSLTTQWAQFLQAQPPLNQVHVTQNPQTLSVPTTASQDTLYASSGIAARSAGPAKRKRQLPD